MEDFVIDDTWENVRLDARSAQRAPRPELSPVTRDKPAANRVATSLTWLPSSLTARYNMGPQERQVSLGRLEFGWVDRARSIGVGDFDVENLTDVFSEIDRALHDQKFEQLQNAIELLQMNELSAELLVAVLRAASPGRPRMHRWKHLLQKVREVIESRGLDSSEALIGL